MGLKTQWCPHCKTNAPQEDAKIPLDPDEKQNWMQRLVYKDWLARIFPELDAAGYLRYRWCVNCRDVWQSVELPASLLRSVLSAHDDAKFKGNLKASTITEYRITLEQVQQELKSLAGDVNQNLDLLGTMSPSEIHQQIEKIQQQVEKMQHRLEATMSWIGETFCCDPEL
jgi:hypothetical protein